MSSPWLLPNSTLKSHHCSRVVVSSAGDPATRSEGVDLPFRYRASTPALSATSTQQSIEIVRMAQLRSLLWPARYRSRWMRLKIRSRPTVTVINIYRLAMFASTWEVQMLSSLHDEYVVAICIAMRRAMLPHLRYTDNTARPSVYCLRRKECRGPL